MQTVRVIWSRDHEKIWEKRDKRIISFLSLSLSFIKKITLKFEEFNWKVLEILINSTIECQFCSTDTRKCVKYAQRRRWGNFSPCLVEKSKSNQRNDQTFERDVAAKASLNVGLHGSRGKHVVRATNEGKLEVEPSLARRTMFMQAQPEPALAHTGCNFFVADVIKFSSLCCLP